MATVQWRPEVNALTTPLSYRVRILPRNIIGDEQLIAEIAARQPTIDEEVVRAVLDTREKLIQEHLINGDQITLKNNVTYSLSASAKLEGPDDSLPNTNDLVNVCIYPSKPFVAAVRHAAKLERLPFSEKSPVIASAEDNRLKLNDVLYAKGVLKLTGSNLFFDETDEGSQCVIHGTRNGEMVQEQYAMISNSKILLVPDIPTQDAPWNNEYTVSVSTQYTEHGTLRTGTYQRRLRTPIAWDGLPHEGGTGILTGNADVPYVTITSGSINANEMLRIQAILDIHAGELLLNLIDMQEDGKVGQTVTVTANGAYTLQGFAGSAVSDLTIQVEQYAELVQLIRNAYSGRIADIIDVQLV